MSKNIEAIADFYEHELNMHQVAKNLYADAALARKIGGPESLTPEQFQKYILAKLKTSADKSVADQANQDGYLRKALRPFIKEYKAAKVHTPELINNTWAGIWRVIGERVDFKYLVPACDRTTEELVDLRIKNRANLLLPDDIYTPDGLVRLGRAFPLMGKSGWLFQVLI